MNFKLTDDHIKTFIRAANDLKNGWPLALAPEVLQKASADADRSYWKWVDASDKAEDAEFDLPATQTAWNKAAEDAVRNEEDLPNRDDLVRAEIAIKVTKEDEVSADKLLRRSQTQLSRLLEDQSVRDLWRLAIEEEAVTMQKELKREIAKIEPLLTKLSLYLGLSRYLGDSGQYNYPPRVISPDPRDGLQQLITCPPWQPSKPAGTISR